jgi:hypothetical protein
LPGVMVSRHDPAASVLPSGVIVLTGGEDTGPC